MMRKMIWLAAALVLVMATGCDNTYPIRSAEFTSAPAGSDKQTGLWVTGEGKMMANPDIAQLSLGIEAQARTVAEAQEQARRTMSKVVDALKAGGVKERDIQTRRFSIYPVTRWARETEQETILGYRVTNIVQAKVRELDLVGEIIDAVAAAGGDLTRVQGISFSIDNPEPYYQEVRIKAIKDAASKAKKLADAAGVRLGKPFYITEGSIYVPQPLYKGIAGAVPAPAAPPTPISPGELEIRLTVQMAYGIS